MNDGNELSLVCPRCGWVPADRDSFGSNLGERVCPHCTVVLEESSDDADEANPEQPTHAPPGTDSASCATGAVLQRISPRTTSIRAGMSEIVSDDSSNAATFESTRAGSTNSRTTREETMVGRAEVKPTLNSGRYSRHVEAPQATAERGERAELERRLEEVLDELGEK